MRVFRVAISGSALPVRVARGACPAEGDLDNNAFIGVNMQVRSLARYRGKSESESGDFLHRQSTRRLPRRLAVQAVS